MLQRALLGGVALLGLLAGSAAIADHRYSSDPQIRLGIDILWGGYGPVYVAPPPVAYYPPPHYAPPYYGPPRHNYRRGYERGYERGYDRGYGGAKWRGKGHDKHRYRKHGHDD